MESRTEAEQPEVSRDTRGIADGLASPRRKPGRSC